MKREILDSTATVIIFTSGRFIYEFLEKGTLSFTVAFAFGFAAMIVAAIIRADLMIKILRAINKKCGESPVSNQR